MVEDMVEHMGEDMGEGMGEDMEEDMGEDMEEHTVEHTEEDTWSHTLSLSAGRSGQCRAPSTQHPSVQSQSARPTLKQQPARLTPWSPR